MASLEKYSSSEVIYEMRHNTREHTQAPSNVDIDAERTSLNFSPGDRCEAQPDKGKAAKAARDRHKARLEKVYHMKRDDVVTACQWVITKPADLPEQETELFWRETMAYLDHKYGAENCIQAIVHRDEGLKVNGAVIAGRDHLHYMFVPVVKNDRYQQPNRYGNLTGPSLYEYKVCADKLITRQHLRTWHDEYQRWLDDHGVHCTVHSGVTGGKNRTVDQLKRETLERELAKAQEQVVSLAETNKALQDRVAALEQERELSKSSGWGNVSGWGKERNLEWGTRNL